MYYDYHKEVFAQVREYISSDGMTWQSKHLHNFKTVSINQRNK